MSKMVEIRDVSLIYHEMQGETLALKGLNLDVEQGEFVSVVGPSGCGKTSMLSMLAGLLQPSGGALWVGDSSPGYVLQRDHLLDWRTIEGNILLGLEVKRICSREKRAYALSLLEKYGLYEFKDAYPRQLSGGMRQKVALIRTLACSPALLLLDEPFSALDFQTRVRLANEIYDIIRREEKTAILVTHDISEAISMSDRVVIFSGRPASVKAEHKLALREGTPLRRRSEEGFKEYFDTIWKELDNEEDQ